MSGTFVDEPGFVSDSRSVSWLLAALTGGVLPELPGIREAAGVPSACPACSELMNRSAGVPARSQAGAPDPCCGRERPRPGAPGSWEEILQTADRQRLAPLLWWRLSRRPSPWPIPSAFLNRLREIYLANAVSTMLHVQELSRVLRELDAAGIPTIVLKGACLAEAVYGNIALRVMGDADVVMHAVDLKRAGSIMRSLGYVSNRVSDLDSFMGYSQHLPRFTQVGKPPFELHWTLFPPRMEPRFAVSQLDDVWARSIPIRLGGAPTRSLCPEDMLLYLCQHASSHHLFTYLGLRSCFDIAEVIGRYQDRLDWDQFRHRAHAWDLRPSAALALTLARQSAHAAVPPSVLHALDSEELPAKVVEQAWTNMLSPTGIAQTLDINDNLVEFGNSPVLGKLRVLARRAFPEREEMAVMYPVPAHSWRIYLCYPVRWRDVLLRHARNLSRLLGQEPQLHDHLRKQQALIHWLRPRE